MLSSVSQVSSGAIEASRLFGHVVHRVAVKVGSKKDLGDRIKVPREVIASITRGEAYDHDRHLLQDLVLAVSPEVHPQVLDHLRDLVDQIKPSH